MIREAILTGLWCPLYFAIPSTDSTQHLFRDFGHLFLMSRMFLRPVRKMVKRGYFVSSCLSVHLSLRVSAWSNSAHNERSFLKFDIEYGWKFCRENVRFITIWQEYRVLYMKINTHLLSYLPHLFLEWEMFQTKPEEVIKTHILCSVTFCFEKVDVCEIMWENKVEPDSPQMAIWRKLISRWVHKTTRTHSEYVILIALPLPQWLHDSASLLGYTYIARLIIILLSTAG
jgi:hypothetical protein